MFSYNGMYEVLVRNSIMYVFYALFHTVRYCRLDVDWDTQAPLDSRDIRQIMRPLSDLWESLGLQGEAFEGISYELYSVGGGFKDELKV